MAKNKVTNWLKRQLAAVAVATSSVEKNALTQNDDNYLEGANTGTHQDHKQGMLSNALEKGEVTQEVRELRWRYYKILDRVEDMDINIDSVDPNNDDFDLDSIEISERDGSRSIDQSKLLKDMNDNYKVELVLENNNEGLGMSDVIERAKDQEQISKEDYETLKNQKPLYVGREYRKKFEIEEFTEKLHVKDLKDENRKLLEFFVPAYKDGYSKRKTLFLSEIKKAMKNPKLCDFLEIENVGFISHNTLGTKNNREFIYEIENFHKITEFSGYYVIKFKAKVVSNGESVIEKYREEELDKKYENKERKD